MAMTGLKIGCIGVHWNSFLPCKFMINLLINLSIMTKQSLSNILVL